MTREEEAIEQLKHMKVFISYDTENPLVKRMQSSLDIAIKALEQPSCNDCISRQAVIKHLENITMDTNPDHYDSKDKWYQANGFNVCKVGTEIYIKNLPSVTPQPKMGRLIFSDGYWRCSACKEKALLKLDNSEGNCRKYMPIKFDYCPDCGAKMEGEK